MPIDEIHSLLAAVMEIPDCYGNNWDTFYDCINDDEASNPPEILIVDGWDNFIRELLGDAKIFWSCIEGRPPTRKPLSVFVTPRACPCCGYLTLSDWHQGSWEICTLCQWVVNAIQLQDPDYEGGANKPSLNQARARFFSKTLDVSRSVKDFRTM